MKYAKPALLLVALAWQSTFAAEKTGTARVELVGGGGGIIDPIEITEVTELDFGLLANINGTCTMGPGGVLSGPAAMNCNDTETPGEFLLTGTAGAVVEVSVSGGQTVDGVTFNPALDGDSLRALSGGNTTVNVVGNVELNNATGGVKDIPYTFTVNYQ